MDWYYSTEEVSKPAFRSPLELYGHLTHAVRGQPHFKGDLFIALELTFKAANTFIPSVNS